MELFNLLLPIIVMFIKIRFDMIESNKLGDMVTGITILTLVACIFYGRLWYETLTIVLWLIALQLDFFIILIFKPRER